MRKTTRCFMLMSLLIIIMLTSCRFVPVSVCDLKENPRKYAERKHVTTRGIVTENTNLLIFKYFILRDLHAECEIMVVTDKILPSKGQTVKVEGTIDESFAFGDERILVIRELSR